jgi:cytochrome P450
MEEGGYVILSHPEALRSILTAEVGALTVCNDVLGPVLGPGSLLRLDGAAHLRERRWLMPGFQHGAISGYGRLINDTLGRATKEWSMGTTFKAHDVLQDLSLAVILQIVFGRDEESRCSELKQGLVELLNDRRLGLGLLHRPDESGRMPALGTFWTQIEHIREVALARVRYARARFSGPDGTLLSFLLAATDETGARRTDEEVRDEVLTLLTTGHETTAAAISWGLYWLARNGEVLARLRAEIAQAPALDSAARTDEGGPYLDATCKEILRIYPIVPSLFRRVAGRPFQVAGRVFGPGTFLSPSIYLTHHREETYPEPDVFNPSRFLQQAFSPYEYLPFGGGSRRCVGMHLALYEMKLVLRELVRRFELELLTPGVAPTRRFVTMAPSGMQLRVARVLG